MNGYEYLVSASKKTECNGDHWFRYLRKVISDEGTSLTSDEISLLLETHELSFFQKVTLEDALTVGTKTHTYILSLNKPSKKRDWNNILEGLHNEEL